MCSTPEPEVVLRDDRGEPYADVVLTGEPPVLTLDDLRLRPERDEAVALVADGLRRLAVGAGATVLEVEVPAGDAVRAAVVDGTRLLGERMIKSLATEPRVPEGFAWRPLTEAELGPWQERSVRAYAEDGLDGFGGDLDLALADARQDFVRLLPDGLATLDTSLVVLAADGVRVGHLWVRHHHAAGRSYVYDVEVDEQHRGRGHGRSAMLVAELLARRAGDTTLGLHVFGWNTVARTLYRSLGYDLRSSTYDLLTRG